MTLPTSIILIVNAAMFIIALLTALLIVYLSGNYHLMPTDQIDEIRQFSPDHIPDLAGAESEEEKDNPVPDDLIW